MKDYASEVDHLVNRGFAEEAVMADEEVTVDAGLARLVVARFEGHCDGISVTNGANVFVVAVSARLGQFSLAFFQINYHLFDSGDFFVAHVTFVWKISME